MGSDKASLPIPHSRNVTFVEHLVSLYTSFCDEVLLVTRDETQAAYFSSFLSLSCTHQEVVRVLWDRVPNTGPLMGLYTGLSAIRNTHALVSAVDMPLVQPELVAFLLSLPHDEMIHITLIRDVPQVLLALYPRAVLPLIEERLHTGRKDPRSLLDVALVRYIQEEQLRTVDPDLRSFVNVNTPEEYERL